MTFESVHEMHTWAPNCATPDCDYKATVGSDYCYCHDAGFNPPLSAEQYAALADDQLPAYRAALRSLKRRAAIATKYARTI